MSKYKTKYKPLCKELYHWSSLQIHYKQNYKMDKIQVNSTNMMDIWQSSVTKLNGDVTLTALSWHGPALSSDFWETFVFSQYTLESFGLLLVQMLSFEK